MKYDEEKLWIAVVERAVRDAIGKNKKLKKEAIKWLHSEAFETTCDLANLDSGRMKDIMRNKYKENFMSFFSEEMKTLLINNINECVSYLLPNGEFYQDDRFYEGNLNGKKIIVELKGENVGNWYNFSREEKGNILELWTLVARSTDSTDTVQNQTMAFPVEKYLSDRSPMPADIIAPRILTPGGLLVIGGTPKIGKSNFLLALSVHLAAGVQFLDMKPAKPLKIFYMQSEIGYHYMRERLQQLKIKPKLLDIAMNNLVITTTNTKITLNSEGIEKIRDEISNVFDPKTVDLIVIDSLYNTLGCGNTQSMLSFLQNGIEKLRSITNPAVGIIITHHTKKTSKASLKRSPFQSLSGAGVLRSFYTSGIVMFRPNKQQNILQVMYELKNGKPIPTKFINEVNGSWKASKVIVTA